jgi:glucose 1-dehydrogenase
MHEQTAERTRIMATLQDRVIVITGGTRGLGLAVARACADEGAQVVISSRSAEAVERAVGELRSAGRTATGMPCDVTELAQVEALAAHATESFGRFDVWVNNAGYSAPYGPTAHVPPQLFLRSIQTNIIGSYHGSIVALRAFLPQERGKLINVLGRGSDGKPIAMQNAYAATKSWERVFTLAMAQEYKESGVGIFAINPGMMTTDMLTDLTAVSGYEGGLKAMPTIVRMWAKPPEVPAQKIVWLASSATDGKTGLEINEMSRGILLAGSLAEGWRRLLRRPAPPLEMKVAVIPAALPLMRRR